MEDDPLWPADVAKIIGVTAETARSRMATGEIPGAQPLGKTYIIERRTLNKALEQGLRKQPARLANGFPWLSSQQVRTMLQEAGYTISHVTVLDWLRKGVLPGKKGKKAWAVPRAKLERMIAEGFEVPARGRPPKDAG